MRVLLVGYAGSTHVQEWLAQFSDHGLEVVHFSPFERAYAAGPKYQNLRQLRDFGRESRRLREIVQHYKPDVVNAHIASSSGILALRAVDLPLVITAYGSDITEFPKRSRMHRLVLGRALARADAITVSSHYLKKALMDLGYGIKTPYVVPFGVDIEAFGNVGIPARTGRFTVGTVKSNEYTYGIDVLIRAFAMARGRSLSPEQWRLVIVGRGSKQREYQQLATDLGLADEVEFRGAVPHHDVPSHLAEFDVFAALSREESFGVAVVEAMAAGIPCVVSDVGGLPEVVGSSGIVVASDDVPAAAAAISKLHADVTLRADFRAEGSRRARDLFGQSACRGRMVAVLAEVAECSSP